MKKNYAILIIVLFAIASTSYAQDPLTNFDGNEYNPRWSYDNGMLGYTYRTDDEVVIEVTDEDGNVIDIIDSNFEGEFSFAFAPDGDRVIFSAYAYNDPPNRLYIYDLNSNETELFFKVDGIDISQPNWSPVYNWLAFTINESEVFKMNLNSTYPLNVSNHEGIDKNPAWSPNGLDIGFTSDRSGNEDIWVVYEESEEPVNLTNHPAKDDCVTWSPEGDRIAFCSDRSGNLDIWVQDLYTGYAFAITDDSYSEGQPSWSPSGDYIIFTKMIEGASDIYIMEIDMETLSTPELETIDLQVFPNPATDNFNLTYQLEKESKVEIMFYQTDGKLVSIKNYASQMPGAYTFNYDVSTLSSGMYIVNVNINGISAKSKILVK